MENATGLTPGQYDFTFVEFELKETQVLRNTMWVAKLELSGYKGYIAWDTFVATPKAVWKWRMFGIEEFDEIPHILKGRTFLAKYKDVLYEGKPRGHIGPYLAEKV